MTEYKKIFLDTAPFIYFLDQTPGFSDTALRVFESIVKNNKPIITSVITYYHYLMIRISNVFHFYRLLILIITNCKFPLSRNSFCIREKINCQTLPPNSKDYQICYLIRQEKYSAYYYQKEAHDHTQAIV